MVIGKNSPLQVLLSGMIDPALRINKADGTSNHDRKDRVSKHSKKRMS